MKFLGILLSIAALIFGLLLGSEMYATSSDISITTMILGDILLSGFLAVSTVSTLYFTYKIVELSYNGLLLGALTSLLLTIETIIIVNTLFPLGLLLNTVVFVLLVVFFFFHGYLEIPNLNKAQIFFIEKTLPRGELVDGPAWFFNIPSLIEIRLFLMDVRTLELFKGDPLSISHGMSFKTSPIKVTYKLNNLEQYIKLGAEARKDWENYLVDSIRNAAILIISSKSEEELNEEYSGLALLLIMDSLKMFKRIILNGTYFESHLEYPILKRDEMYEKKIQDTYANLDDFTKEESQKNKIHIFSDKQWTMLLDSKSEDNLPNRGVLHKSSDIGFTLVDITFGNFTLEDSLQAEILKKRSEGLQREAELADITTLEMLAKKIASLGIPIDKATQLAMLRMDTPNLNYKVTEILSTSDKVDQVIAALIEGKGE